MRNDVGPTAKVHCVVVLDIRSFPDAAEYVTATTPDGWTVARDPDRVVVIHFHFAAPTCDVSAKGKRIQVKCALAP
jgi:hypothetical protein